MKLGIFFANFFFLCGKISRPLFDLFQMDDPCMAVDPPDPLIGVDPVDPQDHTDLSVTTVEISEAHPSLITDPPSGMDLLTTIFKEDPPDPAGLGADPVVDPGSVAAVGAVEDSVTEVIYYINVY